MILPFLLESTNEIAAWNGIGIGSIIMIVMFVIAVGTFYFTMKSNRRADDKAAQDREDRIATNIAKISTAVEPRLQKLEERTSDFLRRGEIIALVDHEKVNRAMTIDMVKRIADANAKDIIDLRIVVGKVEQKHQGLEDDVHEIKDLMREHRKENNEKLDKMMACISDISKRVP